MLELKLKADEKNKGTSGVSDTLTLIRKIVECLSELVYQAEIKASDSGLNIQVMDMACVALADISLSNRMFTEYRCDRDLIIGVQLKTLLKVLRGISIESDVLVEMECSDAATDLVIRSIRPECTMSFCIKLQSLDSQVYSMSELNFQAEAVISVEEFMYVPRFIGTFGDFIAIMADEKSITFSQVGESADASISFGESKEKGQTICVSNGPINKEVAMKYINIIGKVAPLCKHMKISLGTDSTVFFHFSTTDDLAHMKFHIAPRINDDNDEN